MFVKKMTVALMGSVFLLASIPSEAALGRTTSSSSSSSRSSSSSFSKPSTASSSSFSKSAPTQTQSSSVASGGLSQKQTLGVARTDVTNNIRNGTNVAPSNNSTVAGSNYSNRNYNSGSYNNSYPSNYNNGGYYQPQPQGHSTGALVGAAAAGAAVGYLAGNSGHNNGTTIINNGGSNGYPVNNGGVVYENGVPVGTTSVGASTAVVSPVVVESSHSPILSGIWWLIKFIFALAVLFLLIKFVTRFFLKNTNQESGESMPIFTQTVSAETKLRDMKEKFFVDFQKNNRPSGLSFIRTNTSEVLYEALEDLVKQTDEGRIVKIKNLEAKLENIEQEGSRYVATVSYKAQVLEGANENSLEATDIDEFWNFIYINGAWKLNGIEQR